MLLFTSSAVTEPRGALVQYTRPPPYVIMLNLVVLGQTLRELVGVQKTAVLGPVPWSGGVADPHKHTAPQRGLPCPI